MLVQAVLTFYLEAIIRIYQQLVNELQEVAQTQKNGLTSFRASVSAEPNNRERTELRKKFDTVVNNLPKLKGNPFAPEASSKVAAWIDSTFSKSTKDTTTVRGELSRQTAEKSPYPRYFYQEICNNIFKPIPHKRETPYVARAFHLTQPEQRIQDSYFNGNLTNYEDSIMSATGPARHQFNESNDLYSAGDSSPNPNATIIHSKEINGKMKIANTVTAFERDRVDKHKKIREKQLVIEMEHRTMQIINEKRKERQEKEYHTMLKDLAEEKDFKFQNLHVDRKQHY